LNGTRDIPDGVWVSAPGNLPQGASSWRSVQQGV